MTLSPHQNISSLEAGTGPGLSTAMSPALVPAEKGSGEALSLPLMDTLGWYSVFLQLAPATLGNFCYWQPQQVWKMCCGLLVRE